MRARRPDLNAGRAPARGRGWRASPAPELQGSAGWAQWPRSAVKARGGSSGRGGPQRGPGALGPWAQRGLRCAGNGASPRPAEASGRGATRKKDPLKRAPGVPTRPARPFRESRPSDAGRPLKRLYTREGRPRRRGGGGAVYTCAALRGGRARDGRRAGGRGGRYPETRTSKPGVS